MRVLFVTNRFPAAATRGDQLRAFQHIAHLAPRHRITLLCFDANRIDAAALAAMQAYCERVVIAPRSRLGMAWRALGALATRRPLQVAMFDAMPDAAARLLDDAGFDLVHVQLVRLGAVLARVAPRPCVLDLVDALSRNMARRARLERGPLRLLARVDALRLPAFERALCLQATAATVSSAQDRDAIGNHANLHIAGNGVDAERFGFRAPVARGHGMVFVGNLGYFPNIDAARWFARDVLPRIRAAVPDARLQLVGARPAASVRALARMQDGIALAADVPDVVPYLHRAAVAVVPLRAGSGQQLKLLEAMAAGTPVVATALSAQAIGAIDGEHLLVADDAQAMAAAVLRLLRDAALAQRLSAAARALVESRWTWQRSAGAIERVWQAAAVSTA